jgi:hypothetical protein
LIIVRHSRESGILATQCRETTVLGIGVSQGRHGNAVRIDGMAKRTKTFILKKRPIGCAACLR